MAEITIETLKQWDVAYHNGEEVHVSDTEYDQHKTKLKLIFPDDPYFKTVGAEPTNNKVDLPYVMGSLKKKKYNGSFLKWIQDNNITEVCTSDKLDGCSIYVEYLNGSVQFASTRGNGFQGQDITDKAKVFCSDINFQGELHLRGEAMMLPPISENLGYKNPRNAVAGILNRDEHQNVKYIIPVFYAILNDDSIDIGTSHFYKLDELGLVIPAFGTIKLTSVENIEDHLAAHYKLRNGQSSFGIDGIVVSNNIDYQLENEYYPTNTVAFKVNEDAIKAVVKKREWTVTRTGKVKPVVVIEAVDIGGSTIQKATGFNAAFIRDNNIKRGSEIGIVKSGDIIPYITECYDKDDTTSIKLPTNCPCCDTKLEWSPTNIDLICNNEDCWDQKLYHMENFLLSLDVEEMTYGTLLTIGVYDIKDLYTLEDFELMEIDGIGPKKAQTIVTQIKRTLSTSPDKLLKAFGIEGVGSTTSKDVVDHFDSFDTIWDASKEDFKKIDGVGPITAENLERGLKDIREFYDFMLSEGLKFVDQDTSLKGKVFTLTGKSDIKRNDLTKMIVTQGGTVRGVSKKSSYVVTNDATSTTGKMKKAHQYGIEILTYEQLYEMIGV